MAKSQATIYLADHRGVTQTESHRSYHTFNFGSYQDQSRNPVGNLVVLNDDTLAALSTASYAVPAGHVVFILPLVGGVDICFNGEAARFVEAGQHALITVPDSMEITIRNPFDTDLVNFLCCWFSGVASETPGVEVSTFDPELSRNSLLSLCDRDSFRIHIGKFGARADSTLEVNADELVFAFVIDGAFEFQHRLLHQRDGLSLIDPENVGFEALSNDAIVLVIALKAGNDSA